MTQHEPSKIDQLLDLLLDALQERQAARNNEESIPQREMMTENQVESLPAQPPVPAVAPSELENPEQAFEPEREMAAADEPAEPYIPEKLPSINLDRLLGRLAMALLVLIVVVNIPFNRYGTNLARAMPDEQALVIRDGLVLKGEGEEIYVLKDNHKRWISSLDAFAYYGFDWEQVNLVDDEFLDQFPDGPALSILYKCAQSPHVFAIENGLRRWIKDIPTFEAQGYVWEDVQTVNCITLENIPSGPPIPPDAGSPPDP